MRVLVCLTALLLSVPACAAEYRAEPAPTGAPAAPSPVPSATAGSTEVESPTAAPAPTDVSTVHPSEALPEPHPAPGPDVELWFLRDRTRQQFIEPELHRLPHVTPAVARETMELLVSTKPRDPALDNLVPQGSTVLGVTLKDGLLTVDLDFPNDEAGLGVAYEGLLFRAIAHTGAQFPSVRRVRVLEEGRIPPSGHVTDLDGPYAYKEDVVSPVVVTKPGHGEKVTGGKVTVSGTANVYEATVVLRLRNPGGEVVEETFATATCGTGCRGEWEHTFSGVTSPGRWTLVASASDPSDGEGPPPYSVKRTFVVE